MLEVGRILKPHGLRGEVVVAMVSNRPERLATGSVLQCQHRPLRIEHARPFEATGEGRWLVAFAGIASRDDAEPLRGAVLEAPPLDDPDALWAHELIGAQVVATSGESLGRVVAVEANPASDLLVLESGALVPLRFVVARGAGGVTVDAPAGLFDL